MPLNPETSTNQAPQQLQHRDPNVASTATEKTDLNAIIGINNTQNTVSSVVDISKNLPSTYSNFGTLYHTNEDFNKQSETLSWPTNSSFQPINAGALSEEFGSNYANIGTTDRVFGTTDIGTSERTFDTVGDVLGGVNINLGHVYTDKYRLNRDDGMPSTNATPHKVPRITDPPPYHPHSLTPQQILMHREVLSTPFYPSNFSPRQNFSLTLE